jgi:uncharacterized integral membrane protein
MANIRKYILVGLNKKLYLILHVMMFLVDLLNIFIIINYSEIDF